MLPIPVPKVFCGILSSIFVDFQETDVVCHEHPCQHSRFFKANKHFVIVVCIHVYGYCNWAIQDKEFNSQREDVITSE